MLSKGEAPSGHEYELGHSNWEIKRLQRQAQLVDPFTRQFFREAGVAPGMRVLDFGSGAGDVSLLAAELVGDAGEVVGIDAAPLAVTAAWDRIKALGKRNISFRHADLDSTEFVGAFDAVVGRYGDWRMVPPAVRGRRPATAPARQA